MSNVIAIEVTEGDISNGRSKQCDICPIALALSRAIPEARKIAVQPYGVYYSIGDVYFRAEFPEAVRGFVDKFDHGCDVSPFSFVMEPYEW